MRNCLLTQLKEVVNNSNLPYLNEICFNLGNSESTDNYVYITANSPIKYISSGVTLYDTPDIVRTPSGTLNTGWQRFRWTGEGKLRIVSVYNLSYIRLHTITNIPIVVDSLVGVNLDMVATNNMLVDKAKENTINITNHDNTPAWIPVIISGDYNQLGISNDVEECRIANSSFSGDANSIFRINNLGTKLTYMILNGNNVTCSDLSQFSAMTNLTTFAIPYVNIESELTSTLKVLPNLSNIDFHSNITEDFTELFNYWGSHGYAGKTVRVQLNGTAKVNNVDVSVVNANVVFDSNGNWTIQ
jgi:hypothetical protein